MNSDNSRNTRDKTKNTDRQLRNNYHSLMRQKDNDGNNNNDETRVMNDWESFPWHPNQTQHVTTDFTKHSTN